MQSEKTGGVYVSFFSSQTGKCRSVQKTCQWQVFSVGPACSTGGEPTDGVSAYTRLHTSWKCLHFHDIRAKPSAELHWASCCVACILGREKEEIRVEKRKSKKVKLGEK